MSEVNQALTIRDTSILLLPIIIRVLRLSFNNSKYAKGTKNKLVMVENNNPPMMEIAIGEYGGPSPPAMVVSPRARGRRPNTVVATVIMIGLTRLKQPWTMASGTDNPVLTS